VAGKKAEALTKPAKIANNILAYVCAGMLFAMMLLGSADVIGRFLFNKPIVGSLEIFEILLPGIVLLALGYTQAAGAHVRVEILLSRLPPRSQASLNFVTRLVALVISILILWRGVLVALTYRHQDRLISNIGVPMFLPQLFVPLGALGICAVLVVQMLQFLAKLRERG
jgi:TRAP-type C4-dicarboxylate transport system permease small subunit